MPFDEHEHEKIAPKTLAKLHDIGGEFSAFQPTNNLTMRERNVELRGYRECFNECCAKTLSKRVTCVHFESSG
jgi:hypothetical protein